MTSEPAPPVLRLDPEVDMLNAEAVHAEGLRLLIGAGPVSSLVIDLQEVGFLDSAALSTLVKLRLAAIERGGGVVLQNVPVRIATLLEISGLAELFTTA